MDPWSDDRAWDAVEAWRWLPLGSTRVVGHGYEVAVTPGSYALTHAYGLHADDATDVDRLLAELRERVVSLGGTGVRVHLTPRSSPDDLGERLGRAGYRTIEEVEALVCELRDAHDAPRLPTFRESPGLLAREVLTDADYEAFLDLSSPIFGDPTPSEATLKAYHDDFRTALRETGHTGRFIVREGGRPIGRSGMEIVGPVARFWGTGVLAEHRGRGVYGLLVRIRCEEAARRGCEIALVTARAGTSGPILKHHGFRVLGALTVYEARWSESR